MNLAMMINIYPRLTFIVYALFFITIGFVISYINTRWNWEDHWKYKANEITGGVVKKQTDSIKKLHNECKRLKVEIEKKNTIIANMKAKQHIIYSASRVMLSKITETITMED